MAQQNESFWDRVFYPRGRGSSSSRSGGGGGGGGGRYAWPAGYSPSFIERVLFPQGFPGQDPNKMIRNRWGIQDTGASDAAQEAWAKSIEGYQKPPTIDQEIADWSGYGNGAAKPKPVTNSSSGQAIADRMAVALGPLTERDTGETGGEPFMPMFGGRDPGETGGEPEMMPQGSGYQPPPFNVPFHSPEMATPAAASEGPSATDGPSSLLPDWSRFSMPEVSASFTGGNPWTQQPGGAVFGGQRHGGNTFGGNTFGGNTYGGRTGRDVLQAVQNWNGKVYAGGGPVGYFARGGRLRTHGGPIPTVDDYRSGKGPPRSADGRSQHFAWAALIPAAMSMVGSIAGAAGKGGGGGGGGGMAAPSMPAIAPPPMAAPAQIRPIDFIPGDEPDEKMAAHGGRMGFMRGGYPELYNKPVRQGYFSTGGGSNYVRGDGQGNGRSDHIDALLSPGEYVMDAETVSLMGDGDNEAGARKFDALRKNVRVHKGKKLAKGQFSPQAKKHAEEYLARDAISDGFRQHGRG